MKFFKPLISSVRTNGCHHFKEGRIIRQIVYTNMIWLVSYLTYILYSLSVLLLGAVPSGILIPALLVFHLLYITCFLLVRHNLPTAGKHTLVLTTYLAVSFFDHLTGRDTMAFLFVLAFLPTAMNIFSLKENRATLYLYLAFPLVYTLVTRLFTYEYAWNYSVTGNRHDVLTAINICLSFILFLLFAGYMILNNIAKQRKLLVQSLSLQATLDNSAAAIWSIDNEFTLLAINEKYKRSVEEEFGIKDIKTGICLKDHPVWEKLPREFRKQYDTVLSGLEIIQETELNGKFFEIKGVPVYDLKGNIQGATFGSIDITERKRWEELLLEAKRTAEEAGKAKARFLSNMSHELRTPLNGIIGITQIMQDEEYLPAQQVNLQTLQDLSEHTLQVVNSILDFAKIEAGKAMLDTNRFNLKRFSEKVSSLFSGTAQLKGIQFYTLTEGNPDIFVMGDEVRISQVLINLLGNAFKFTDKGAVTFKTIVKEHMEDQTCYVSFIISDTGIGIKKENLGKIFESFSQGDSDTTRKFGGTGLGLTIADKILQLMNSQLHVESEQGLGSSFYFDLALKKSSLPLPHLLPESNGDFQLPGVKILVAEDNRVNQIVAARILEKWKVIVTIAPNGEKAIEEIRSGDFDVILMDLDMPVMDGYDAIEILKQQYPEVPVIALTAASFDNMKSYLNNKGFDEVVQKPFKPEDLYNKITQVLN